MSEHLSITPNKNDKNVLVPRGDGHIDVMLLSDKFDEAGRQIAYRIGEDGKIAHTRAGLPQAYGDEVQSHYAHKLAMDRNPTPEQMERGDPDATVELDDVADKLDAVADTYGDEGSKEQMLEDARSTYREQLAGVVEELNERLPALVGKHEQNTEQLAILQTAIDQQLGAVADLLSRGPSVSPWDIEAILNEMQSTSRNFAGQTEAVNTKRRISRTMLEGVADAKTRILGKSDEYQGVVVHLSQELPVDDNEQDERADDSAAAREALEGMVALEESIRTLEDKLGEVNSRVEDSHRNLRIAQNRLQEIYENMRRNGGIDPDDFRYVTLMVNEVQQAQMPTKQAMDELPSLTEK